MASQQSEVCIPCGQQFDDWKDYIRHLITSGNHPHACATCGQEFRSEEGKQSHQRQAHQADQELTCTGCHKEFTRCGSLVQHVEIDGCPVFRKLAFEKIRDANEEYYKKMGIPKKRTTATTGDNSDKAHAAVASRATCEVPKASPAPASRVQPEIPKASPAPSSRVQYEVLKASPAPASRVLQPSDLMTDSENPSEELNLTYPVLDIQNHGQGSTDDVSTPEKPTGIDSPTKNKAEVDLIEMSPNARAPKRAWPGLTGPKPSSIAAGDPGNNNVRNDNVPWGKEVLEISPPPVRPLKFSDPVPDHFSASNQPPNLRSPMLAEAGLDLGTLSKPSNILQPFQELKLGEPQLAAQFSESIPEKPAPKYYHQYNPDQPGFNLEQYRNPYSKKYKCAFGGCTKLLNSAEGLYMHLKSNAHLTDLYSCPFCFNQFHSASAITQHLESQTTRCNAREDRRFNQIIDQVAAGMIDTAGTHDDNTHRYYSAQVVPKLQLDTAHEAEEEVITNAVHDPEYRLARLREREQRQKEDKDRDEAWQNDDWAE